MLCMHELFVVKNPFGLLPPCQLIEPRVTRLFAICNFSQHFCQRRLFRRATPNIKSSRLVDIIVANQQRIPIKRSKKRPSRNGLDIGSERAQALRCGPDLIEPANLLIRGASDMSLGNGHGPMIALPYLKQSRGRTQIRVHCYPNRLDVCVTMSIISAVSRYGIFIKTFVQISIARQVMIHAKDVWRAGILHEPLELTLLDAAIPKIVPQWVWLVDAAAQQIKCQ